MATGLGEAAVSGVASKVAESAFDVIGRQISYVFNHQSYIKLEKRVHQDLKNKRQRVEVDVKKAETQGEEIFDDVEQWLNDVKEFTNGVNNIIREEEEAKKCCFKGLCPNLMKRYMLSRKAEKAAEEVTTLLGKGNLLSSVSHGPYWRGKNSINITGYEKFNSRMLKLEEIIKELMDPDLNIIGVWGMGGVGKTTLVKKLAWQVTENKLFDRVIMAEVTETIDCKKIQEDIAYGLGLKFGLEFTNSERSRSIRETLKKEKRVLVIIDDLRGKLDLEDFGIFVEDFENASAHQKEEQEGINDNLLGKLNSEAVANFVGDHLEVSDHQREEREGTNNNPVGEWAAYIFEHSEEGSNHQKEEREGTNDSQSGVVNDNQRRRKILLTSRDSNVLTKEMGTKKNIFVSPLSSEEALIFFQKIVQENLVNPSDDPASQYDSDGKSAAVEIVDICGGLPLAIKTTATSLKGEGPENWNDALKQLNRCNLGDSMHSIIKWSYDSLKDKEAKLIFQLCGLFNAGYSIHIDHLLSYAMIFELFEDYKLKEARNRLYKLIGDLKAACLLLEDDICQRFKMHDIIRIVAVRTASTELNMFNLQSTLDLKEKLEDGKYKDSTAIFVPFGDISELPERLKCPKLKLFLLFSKNSSLKIPDAFFEGTEGLKVLNLSFIHFLSLPSSLRSLTVLRTLYLEYCQLEDIRIIGGLTKLEILSFRGSDIRLLPTEIGQLTRLRLLNLGDCSQLEIITPNVLSNLSKLEELYMGGSHVKWEVEGLNDQQRRNASLAELKKLSCMTTLMIHIQDPQCMPQDLFSQQVDLERFRIVIGDEESWYENYESTRMLKLKLNNNIHLRLGIRMLLKKTEDLFLDELSGVRDYVYELDGEGFKKLKYLRVHNGPELLYIVNSMGQVPYNAFPMLESLFLDNLIKLEKIYQGQLTKGSFSNLKLLEVDNCCSLRYLFTPIVVLGLEQLKKLAIKDCDMLEEIIKKEGEDDAAAIDKILFHRLETIILESLPKLRSFYSGSDTLEFLLLKSITMRNCPKMERFVSNDIEGLCLHPQPLFCDKVLFPTLESFIVDHCDSLRCMFSSSTFESLSQLKTLGISFCELMEFFVVPDEERTRNMPLFPKLHLLELRCLPKLRRFCYFTGDIFELSFLSYIRIDNCPNMVTFISNYLCTSTATIKECDELDWGEIQVDIQPFFDEKVRLPSLEKLKISSMPYLRKIWQNQSSLESFNNLRDLTVEKCDKLLNIFPSNVLGRLETLDTLTVRNCELLDEIFEPQALSGRKMPAQLMAGKLRELNLYNLPKLKYVWNMQSEIILAFQNLVSIKVSYCHSLRSIFPASVAGSLNNLEVLEIFSCQVKEIVAKEEVHVPTFEFPQLTSLSLSWLPNLTNFYPGIHISRWPKLKKLIVSDCENVKIFASESLSLQDGESQHELPIQLPLFIVDPFTVAFSDLEELKLLQLPNLFHFLKKLSQPSKVFRNLRTLQVSCCDSLEILLPRMVQLQSLTTLKVVQCRNLIHLMTLSTATSLEQLTSLDISFCEMLKEIIARKEDGDQKDQLSKVLRNLRTLQVSCCDSLEILLPSMVQLQTLTTLKVVQCHNLINLMTLSTAKNLEQLTNLDISSCQKLKEIIAHKEDGDQKDQPSKVFRNLRTLQVSCCDSLEILLPGMVQLQTLTTLKVVQCHKLINVMTLPTATSLEQLTSLDISFCEMLKEIIAHKNPGDQKDQPSKVFRNLRTLQVSCCDSIEILLPSMVQLQTLTTLEVVECHKLINLMTLSTAKSLEQLTNLYISSCQKLKEIVAHRKNGGRKDQLSKVFPNLKNLLVSNCDDLEMLLPPEMELPSQTTVEVKQCDKLIQGNRDVHHDKRSTWKKFLGNACVIL